VSLVASLLGSVEVVSVMMFPLAMLMAAMFFTSLYFTFHDCFEETASDSV